MANNIRELQPSSNDDLRSSPSLKFRTAPFGPPIVRDNEYQNPGRLKFGSKSGNAYGQNEQANFFLVDTFTQINAKKDKWKSGPSSNSKATDFFTEHCGFYTSPGGPSCRWDNWSGTGNPHKHAGMAATVRDNVSGKKFVYDVGHATKTNKDMECYEYGVVGISGLVFPDKDDYYEYTQGDGKASMGVQHIYGMYRCDLTQEKYDELEDIQSGVGKKIEELLEWLEDLSTGTTQNSLFTPIREKGFSQGLRDANLKPEEFEEKWSFKSLVDEVDWPKIRERVDRNKRQKKFFDPKFGRRLDNILGTLSIPNTGMGKHVLSLLVELFQSKLLRVDVAEHTHRADLLYEVLEDKGSIDGKDIFNWLLRCNMGDEEYIDKWQGKFNFDNIFDWFKGIDEDTMLTVGETYFLYNCYFHQGFKDKDEYGRYTCLIDGQNYTYNAINYDQNYTGPVVDAPEAHAYSVAEAVKESYAPEPTVEDIALFSDTEDNIIIENDLNSRYSFEDYCSLYNGVLSQSKCSLITDWLDITRNDYKDREAFRRWCSTAAGGGVNSTTTEYAEYTECTVSVASQASGKSFLEFCRLDLKGRHGRHHGSERHEDDPWIKVVETGVVKDRPDAPSTSLPTNQEVAGDDERCYFDYGTSSMTGYLWNMGANGVDFWLRSNNQSGHDSTGVHVSGGNFWDGNFFDIDTPSRKYMLESNWQPNLGFESYCRGVQGKLKDKNGVMQVAYTGQASVENGQIICKRYNIPEFESDIISNIDSRNPPSTNFDMYWVPNSLFSPGAQYNFDIPFHNWSKYFAEQEKLVDNLKSGKAPTPEWNKYSKQPVPLIIEPKSFLRTTLFNLNQYQIDKIYTEDRLYKSDFSSRVSVVCTTLTTNKPTSGSDCVDIRIHGPEPSNLDLPEQYDSKGNLIELVAIFENDYDMNQWVNEHKKEYDKDIFLQVTKTVGNSKKNVLHRLKANNQLIKEHDPFYGFFDRTTMGHSWQESIIGNDTNQRKYVWFWNYDSGIESYANLNNKPWRTAALIGTTDDVYAGNDLTKYPVKEQFTANEFFWLKSFEEFCDANHGELKEDKFKNKRLNPQYTCNFDKKVRAVETEAPSGTIIPPTNPELEGMVNVTFLEFQRNNHFEADFCPALGEYSVKNKQYDFYHDGRETEDRNKFYKNTREEICSIDLNALSVDLMDFEDWAKKYNGEYIENFAEKDLDKTYHDFGSGDIGQDVVVFDAGLYPITYNEYYNIETESEGGRKIDTFSEWCELNAKENNERVTQLGRPTFQPEDDTIQLIPEKLPVRGYSTDSFYRLNSDTGIEECLLYRNDVEKTDSFTSLLPLSFKKWCDTSSVAAKAVVRNVNPGWDYNFETGKWEEMPEESMLICRNPFMFNAYEMNQYYYDNMTTWQDLNYYCKRSNAQFYRNKSFWPEWAVDVIDWVLGGALGQELDEQRAICFKAVNIHWDYTFDSWCENYDGVLGETESADGIPLGNGCTIEGVDFPFLEEFWDDSPDGFRFWCALNGGTNINGNNPDMSPEVSAFFKGDGCHMSYVDEESGEEVTLFFTYSDTGEFAIPYAEYLPYLRDREKKDHIFYGDKDVAEVDEDSVDTVDIIRPKDLYQYSPMTVEYIYKDDQVTNKYSYPLEKYLYQERSVPVYRSTGVDRRPDFKGVRIFVPVPLNFENNDVSKLAVESPKSNKFVVQLWYSKEIIDADNSKTVNLTPGPTVGPGQTIGVEVSRAYRYIYLTEINQNADDTDYEEGKYIPLTFTDYNNIGKAYIYPVTNWDNAPDLSQFLSPTAGVDNRQFGAEMRIKAQKGDWPKAVGMQVWWTDKSDGTGPHTRGERIDFDKLTTLQILGDYAIFAMVDPTFRFGQDPMSSYLNGIPLEDSTGKNYIQVDNAAIANNYAYLTDDKRRQPNWSLYSKPFKAEVVQKGEYKVDNNSKYDIILYYQASPLDPTDQTNNPVRLLGNSTVIKPGESRSVNVTESSKGNIIIVIVDPNYPPADFPKDGKPIEVKFSQILATEGNTQVVWQDQVNKWSDPFWNPSMIPELPDDPLDPTPPSPAEEGYITDRDSLKGKKFERDSVYEGTNQSRSGDTYLQMWWNNSPTIRSLDTPKKGVLLDPGSQNTTEFVALDEYAFFGSYRNNSKNREEWGPVRFMNTSFTKKQGEGSRGNATAYWGVYTNNQPPNWAKYTKPIRYVQVSKGSTYTLTSGSSKDYELTCYFSDTATPPSSITTDWAQRTVTLTQKSPTKTKIAKGKYMYVMASTPQGSFDDLAANYIDIQNEEEWGSNGRKVIINLKEMDSQIGATGASGITWPGGSGIGSTDFPWPGSSLFPGASWPGASRPTGSSRPSGGHGGTEGIISSGFLFRLIYDTLNRYTNKDLDDLGYVASWLLAIVIEEICIALYAIGVGEILAIIAMVIYGTEALVSGIAGKFRKTDVVAEFYKDGGNNELKLGRGVSEANGGDLSTFCKWPDLQARFMNLTANELVRAYLKYTFCRSNGYLFHLTASAKTGILQKDDFQKVRNLRIANIANTYSYGFVQMEAPGYRKILRRYYDSFEPIGNYAPGSDGAAGVGDSDWNIGDGTGTKNYSKDLGVEYETTLELDVRKDTIRNQPEWNEDEMWFKIDLSRAIRGAAQEKVRLRGGNYYYIGKLGADKPGDAANNQSWVNGVTEQDIGIEEGGYAWNLFNGKGAGTKYKSYYDDASWSKKKHKTWAWEVTTGEPDWWPIQIPEEGAIPGVEFNMKQLNIDQKNSSESDSFRIYADWQLNYMHLTFQEYETIDIIQDNEKLPGYGEVVGTKQVLGKYRVFPLKIDPDADIPYKMRESWDTDPGVTDTYQLLNPGDSLYMKMKAYSQGPVAGDLLTNRHGVDGKIYPNYKFVGFSVSASIGDQAHLARYRSFIFRYFRPLLYLKDSNGKYTKTMTLNEARETGKYVVPNFKKDVYQKDVDLSPYTETAPGNLVSPLLAPASTPTPPATPTPTPPATPPSGGYGY